MAERGRRNLDQGEEGVIEAELARAAKNQARRIYLYSALLAILGTAGFVLLSAR